MINSIITFSGYIIAIWGVDYFIQLILKKLLKIEKDDDLKNRIKGGIETVGRYIGWTERFLIFSMVSVGYYSGIGFVLAAKSLLRMGDFVTKGNEKKFSEYVILGSLLSFSLAFCLGLLIRSMLSLPVQMKIN